MFVDRLSFVADPVDQADGTERRITRNAIRPAREHRQTEHDAGRSGSHPALALGAENRALSGAGELMNPDIDPTGRTGVLAELRKVRGLA
jgi:hypothetical protein